jgi:predicted DNA-binding protein YlxM (UPF0122 family)
MLGYTVSIVEANKRADARLLGVKLGRLCIALDVPVQEVAEAFSVSRQTVYHWFRGLRQPRETVSAKIEAYIAKNSR